MALIPQRLRGAIARALMPEPVTKDAGGAIWGGAFRTFMGINDPGQDGLISDSPADYAKAFTSESYVFRCMDLRAKSLASVPLKVWETTADGKRNSVDHDALALLQFTNPLGYVDGVPKLMRYTLNSLDGHGRCTWQLGFNGKGAPTEIYWLVPTAVQPLHGYEVDRSDIPFGGVKFTTKGGNEYLAPDQIVYLSTDNPADPIMGISKIGVLRRAINLRAASANVNQSLLANSLIPPWVLKTGKNLTEEQHEKIQHNLRRFMSGAANQTPLVIGAEADVHEFGINHKDMQWLEQQRLSQEEISAAYGVPLIFLSNLDRATYDNIRTAKRLFWETIITEGDSLAADLTRSLLRRFWTDARSHKLEFGFDYSQIEGLGEDIALVWERVSNLMASLDKQVQNKELTPNQARIARQQLIEGTLGLDASAWKGDVPGGDTFYVPLMSVPVEQASVQAIIDVEAARGTNPQLETDVPGAEHIGERANRPNPDDERNQPPEKPKPQKSLDLDDVRALIAEALEQKAAEPTPEPEPLVIQKAPHPGPIRDARCAPIEKSLERRLKRYFQGLQQESLRTLRAQQKAAQTEPGPAAPGDFYDRVASVKNLMALLAESIEATASTAWEAGQKEFALPLPAAPADDWLPTYMGSRADMIQGIDDTTAEQLRESLTEGSQAGEDMDQLSGRVSKVFRHAIDHRAKVIARTEVMQAYALSSLASYRAAGLTQCQMHDGPNADSAGCIDVDGQVVSLDEAERLMGLEHPNGTRLVGPYIGPDLVQRAAPEAEVKLIAEGVRLVA